MKKVLIFALVATAIFGCKRDVNSTGGELPDPNSDVISLISGQPSLGALGRAANKGVRVHFEVGDQLGLFAAYEKATPDTPDWAVATITEGYPTAGRYFVNKPAYCSIAGSTDAGSALDDKRREATFTWGRGGAEGSGGVDHNQIYPKGDKLIYVYAYYPYDVDDVTNVTVDAETGPKIKLELNEGTLTPNDVLPFTVDITADDFIPTQSDVLHASGTAISKAKSVKRTDKLDSLVFNHALAQFQIELQRPVGSRVSEYTKIEFTTFFKGDMTLTTGAIAPQIEMTTTENDHKLTYVITPKAATTEPEATAPNVDIPEIGTGDAYKPLTVLKNPLMLLPLDAANFKLSTLSVWLKFDDDKDTDAAKEFKVNLTDLTDFTLQQGKLNTLTLTLAETGVELEGNVALWGTVANSTVIPVE